MKDHAGDFLIGTIPGAIGETSSLLIILAFIYLVIKKVIKVYIVKLQKLYIFMKKN